MNYARIFIKFLIIRVYSSLCYIFSRARVPLLSFFLIYFDSHPRLSRSRVGLHAKFATLYSICKNIQVRVIVVSTVKKFYIFSLEYGMQSDRPQSNLRRSKTNPTQVRETQVKRPTRSIGHAVFEEGA